MLDRLAGAGAPNEQVAMLEWWYNPALSHRRTPSSFNAMLARDPVLFARIVALVAPSDRELDERSGLGNDDREAVVDHVVASDQGAGDHAGNAGTSEGGDDKWRFPETAETRHNAFEILHNWRHPFPASEGDDPPETAALQRWVDRARAELALLERTRTGARQIGQALSGAAFDPDGTWPCRAVRDVLERENDSQIEAGLWSGQMNSRGVTARDPYSGGQQERNLAAKFKGWADEVRGTWPRSGALLDSIAQSHETEALRQDRSADDLGDR